MRKPDEDPDTSKDRPYKSKELVEENKKINKGGLGRTSTKRKKLIKKASGIMSELEVKIMVTESTSIDDISCHSYGGNCDDDIDHVTSEMIRLTEEEGKKFDIKL